MFMFSASTNLDLTVQPRVTSIGGWHVTGGAAGGTVEFRDGSATGSPLITVKVPALSTVHFSASKPILFGKGVFIVPDANVSGTLIPG